MLSHMTVMGVKEFDSWQHPQAGNLGPWPSPETTGLTVCAHRRGPAALPPKPQEFVINGLRDRQVQSDRPDHDRPLAAVAK
jgi:hypothetical protein